MLHCSLVSDEVEMEVFTLHRKIELIEPVLRCHTEEEVFFQRLSEVTGLLKVIQNESKIYVWVASGSLVEAQEDLSKICDMWHTSFAVLPISSHLTRPQSTGEE